MDRHVPSIQATMTVHELTQRIAQGDPQLTRRQGTPIVDQQGELVGIITRGDLMEALARDPRGESTVLNAGTQALVVAYPDETLRAAVSKMLQNEIGRLPVVSRDNPRQLLGYIGRSGVMAARQRWHQEEMVRERPLAPRNSLPRV